MSGKIYDHLRASLAREQSLGALASGTSFVHRPVFRPGIEITVFDPGARRELPMNLSAIRSHVAGMRGDRFRPRNRTAQKKKCTCALLAALAALERSPVRAKP